MSLFHHLLPAPVDLPQVVLLEVHLKDLHKYNILHIKKVANINLNRFLTVSSDLEAIEKYLLLYKAEIM